MERPPQRQGAAGILSGVVRLALGRADGVYAFSGTAAAFLSSLTPWLALLVVRGAWQFVGDGGTAGTLGQGVGVLAAVFGDSLVVLTTLLAPAVLSHALAVAWGREGAWLRYAVAFNWCQWAVPVAFGAALILLRMVATLGVPYEAAGTVMILAFAGYVLWLHWFLSRVSLDLGKGRALAFVLIVNLGTAALILVPRLLTGQVPRAA